MTYSASAKENLLDIPKKIIIENGVVSEATAKWMAERTRIKMDTDFGVSFTGVAGPDTLEEIPQELFGSGYRSETGRLLLLNIIFMGIEMRFAFAAF